MATGNTTTNNKVGVSNISSLIDDAAQAAHNTVPQNTSAKITNANEYDKSWGVVSGTSNDTGSYDIQDLMNYKGNKNHNPYGSFDYNYNNINTDNNSIMNNIYNNYQSRTKSKYEPVNAYTESEYNNLLGFADKSIKSQNDAYNVQNELVDKQQQLYQDQYKYNTDKQNSIKGQQDTGAYVDYMTAVNQYGANAEQAAAYGLNNSGYEQTSQAMDYRNLQQNYSTFETQLADTLHSLNTEYEKAKLEGDTQRAELILQKALQAQQLESEVMGQLNNINQNSYNMDFRERQQAFAEESSNRDYEFNREQFDFEKDMAYKNYDLAVEQFGFDKEMTQKNYELSLQTAKHQQEYQEASLKAQKEANAASNAVAKASLAQSAYQAKLSYETSYLDQIIGMSDGANINVSGIDGGVTPSDLANRINNDITFIWSGDRITGFKKK